MAYALGCTLSRSLCAAGRRRRGQDLGPGRCRSQTDARRHEFAYEGPTSYEAGRVFIQGLFITHPRNVSHHGAEGSACRRG
ncbi:hypothetical protein BH24ACT2_BH24ACT2_03010 [soil metagenome]